jgi:hypothetical protein
MIRNLWVIHGVYFYEGFPGFGLPVGGKFNPPSRLAGPLAGPAVWTLVWTSVLGAAIPARRRRVPDRSGRLGGIRLDFDPFNPDLASQKPGQTFRLVVIKVS